MISRKFFILQKSVYTYICVSTRYWSEEDMRLCIELTGGHVTPSLRPWPGSPVGAGHQDFFP
jgi:hypothetical protein